MDLLDDLANVGCFLVPASPLVGLALGVGSLVVAPAAWIDDLGAALAVAVVATGVAALLAGLATADPTPEHPARFRWSAALSAVGFVAAFAVVRMIGAD